MHALICTLLILVAAALPLTSLAQSGPDDRYRIQLTIQGAMIEGSQERTARLIGKSPAEQEAILQSPLPTLTRGSTFQLSVTVTDPSGLVTNYTGSPSLRYETFGCLSVTATGVVTVVASRACSGADKPGLWVAFMNSSQKGAMPVTYNEYLFAVQ